MHFRKLEDDTALKKCTYPHIEMIIVYVLHLTWSSGQEKLTLFQSQEMLTVLQGH